MSKSATILLTLHDHLLTNPFKDGWLCSEELCTGANLQLPFWRRFYTWRGFYRTMDKLVEKGYARYKFMDRNGRRRHYYRIEA